LGQDSWVYENALELEVRAAGPSAVQQYGAKPRLEIKRVAHDL
jgi:hypothetical protein